MSTESSRYTLRAQQVLQSAAFAANGCRVEIENLLSGFAGRDAGPKSKGGLQIACEALRDAGLIPVKAVGSTSTPELVERSDYQIRFGEEAGIVLASASEIACGMGREYVGPEHIALAILEIWNINESSPEHLESRFKISRRLRDSERSLGR